MRIKESAQTEPEAWEAEYDLYLCEFARSVEVEQLLKDDPDYASWSDSVEVMYGE